ncbi:succinate dehydrogenase [uncultured Azohydromonas sp.]|jgi:Succinate dehydrogenase, hydrophobic anchor subunit|uniref:succinate dehydrogenase n=1 Tax=uncultured Azohydromonas sp. TaxID=487342 RepID=UPI00261E887E|nr:succinate dehydrogenase [uncultured Azohydromonas sp.]
MEQRLFALQRLSAMVMAPFVLVHLAVILYAIRGGLTAAEVLGRTQGNPWWITFYSLFVISVGIHVPIGMRNILIEWGRFERRTATVICMLFALVLLAMGLRAVMAVGGRWS